MRLPRPLDAVETRILGAFLEKELLTPDAYPMTLQALVAACNQRTSREPVTDLSASDVTGGLDRLRELVLAWKVTGSRADKWEHNLDAKWQLGKAEKSLVALGTKRGDVHDVDCVRAQRGLLRYAPHHLTEAVRSSITGDEMLAVANGEQRGRSAS